MNNSNFLKIMKLALTLTVICVVAGGLLALTYAATEKQIERQAKIEEMKSSREALPAVKKADGFKLRDDLAAKARKKYKDIVKIYEGFDDGRKVGWVVQVAPRGYGGPVSFAVGVDVNGKVAGISLIENKETPGLGQNIEKPEFRGQFEGKSESDPLQVGEDIDALTAATISSKAMALGVREALLALKMLGGR